MAEGKTGTEQLTRDRIVESAMKLFFERGTFGASMRDLAEEAGVSVQGLYYHFASKQDLVRAVLEAPEGINPKPRLPTRVAGRVETQLRAQFGAFRNHLAFNGILAVESVRRQPDAVAALMDGYEEWVGYWRDHVLQDAKDIDPKADLDAAARVITTFAWGLNITFLITLDSSLEQRIGPFSEYLGKALAVQLVKPPKNSAKGASLIR